MRISCIRRRRHRTSSRLPRRREMTAFPASGQNVWERDEELVAPFIKKMGSQMTYRVGLDTVEGEQARMAQTWMEAAGQNGIPAAFVVDKRGIIAWIGHPIHLKEDLL